MFLLDAALNGAPAAAKAAGVTTEVDLSLWELCLRGGWLMLPIALLSLVCVYVFIERAVVIYRAGRTDDSFMKRIRAYVHEGELARTYSMSGDRKKAIGVLRQLLQYIEKNSQSLDSYPRQFCLVAYNYAIDLALERDYEKSIRYAEKCREVGNANGCRDFLPGCMAILGECYFFLGDRKRSRDCYTQAFYLFKAYGNKRDLATVRQEMRERLGLEMPG